MCNLFHLWIDIPYSIWKACNSCEIPQPKLLKRVTLRSKMSMALMSCDMNLYSFLQPEWLSTIWSRSVSSIHFMHVLSFPGMYEKSERKVRIYIATRGCWETPMDFGSNFETGLWLASNLLAFTAPELWSGEVERKGPCKELGAGAIYVQSIPSLDWYPIKYLENLQ